MSEKNWKRIVPAALGVVLLATGARAWVSVPAPRLGVGRAVAVFANGDFVATENYYDSQPQLGDIAIVRVDGSTGTVLWLRELNATGHDEPHQVAIDSAGNVVTMNVRKSEVWKLDGATGEVLWQVNVGGGEDAGAEFAIDAHDDVVVAAASGTWVPHTVDVYAKLEGATGAVVWRVEKTYTAAVGLALDAQGDLFVVSTLDNGNVPQQALARKLSGLDGSVVWESYVLPEPFGTEKFRAVALDGSGRFVVLATGVHAGDETWVLRSLNPATGEIVWKTTIQGEFDGLFGSDRPSTLAVSGDAVYACGSLATPSSTDSSLAVVSLDAATGAERWRQVMRRSNLARSVAHDIVVDADGSLVVTGQTVSRKGYASMFVSRLRGGDGHPLWETSITLASKAVKSDGAAIAIDAYGNIGVAGTLDVPNQSENPTVVKLRPNGTSFEGLATGLRRRAADVQVETSPGAWVAR